MINNTAGPWHVAGGCQIRSEKDQIAKIWMMRNGEGKSNANLIAAAHELLDALIDAEAKLCVAEYHLDRGEDDSIMFETEILNARAAIAKARGEFFAKEVQS
jgi:hypothetical protein